MAPPAPPDGSPFFLAARLTVTVTPQLPGAESYNWGPQLEIDPPSSSDMYPQWIGLRENLQETMVFTIKYRAFL